MSHHHKLSYHQPPIDNHEPNHDPLLNPLTRKKSKTKSSNPDNDHDPPIKNKIIIKTPLNHDHDPPRKGRHSSEIQQPSYHETQTKSSHTTIDPQFTIKPTEIHCHRPITTAKIHHHQTHKP